MDSNVNEMDYFFYLLSVCCSLFAESWYNRCNRIFLSLDLDLIFQSSDLNLSFRFRSRSESNPANSKAQKFPDTAAINYNCEILFLGQMYSYFTCA